MGSHILKWGLLGGIAMGAVWYLNQPVQISAVHSQQGKRSAVLAANLPLTQEGKIAWWREHEGLLKAEYGIPDTYPDGNFSVVFWAWDGGYRVDRGTDEDSDLLCFDDMPGKANCIEKRLLMRVSRYSNGEIHFTVSGLTGEGRYVLPPGGDLRDAQ